MDFKNFKEMLFKKAKEAGFEDCEIYYSDGESLSINIYEEKVEKYSLEKSFGVSFRGMLNGKIGYSYTETLDIEAIDMLIENAKDGALVIENEDIQFIYEGDKSYSNVKTYSEKLENIAADKMIKLAIDMEKKAKAYSDKVVNIRGCKVAYRSFNYGIYNTKGLALKNEKNLLSAYVIPIVEEDNKKYNGMGYGLVNSIDEIDPDIIAKEGVEEALSRINGKSIASGTYKAIIFNEAMASLLDSFSNIFNADKAQKGLSLLKGKEGEIIASSKLTLIDNPLLNYGLGSTPFDDEGSAAFKKEVVSKGKLITLLHNLKTANKQNVKTTGNGFKSSYSSQVGVHPSNLYIENGNNSLEDMNKDLEEGILVTDFAGLHSGTNFITGDFSLAAKGFYIKDGKKDFPIEQITVAGNFFDLLKEVEEVGNDLKFPLSNVGSPSILIKKLSIAGK